MYIGRQVPVIFCHLLMKLKFSQPIFKKHSNMKFNENTSSRSRVALRERTDRQT